ASALPASRQAASCFAATCWAASLHRARRLRGTVLGDFAAPCFALPGRVLRASPQRARRLRCTGLPQHVAASAVQHVAASAAQHVGSDSREWPRTFLTNQSKDIVDTLLDFVHVTY